ncbi:SIR2 family protein [Rhodococcus sp. NCIMB 12038]|uniref:SIR2 family NAD-dependent protein deacylase n=1 Tax=Rhodococcus sp. NCIMB 12038 TaxID=933800 RepID=UPI000B3D3BD0|nr:SIR2 family protein [Rhodococcus sp. NCIMB 12038]OUS93091.1 hypothetical protein CA951_26125 [Rhodococcus sp. NCIMB 12038]
MAIKWPQSLLTEVAERRCVVVLGAGASASSASASGVTPPDWTTFIEAGVGRMSSAGDRDAAMELLRKGAALDAAQIVADSLGKADFALFIRDQFEKPCFLPSELHRLILEIDPKVMITTNYDTILESLARGGAAAAGYNVCRYYDRHLINDLRSNRRVIIKAHGCVSDPQNIVLTRKQYFEARRDSPHFYAALDAIFLNSTLLFIGTGFMGDPDIELLLQTSYIAAPSDHTHYAVVQGGRHPSVTRAIEETYNIRFLEYEEGKHDQVVEALRSLSADVSAYRAVGGS